MPAAPTPSRCCSRSRRSRSARATTRASSHSWRPSGPASGRSTRWRWRSRGAEPRRGPARRAARRGRPDHARHAGAPGRRGGGGRQPAAGREPAPRRRAGGARRRRAAAAVRPAPARPQLGRGARGDGRRSGGAPRGAMRGARARGPGRVPAARPRHVIVAGADVGNSTTEVAFARLVPGAAPEFLLVLRAPTSGPQGSLASGGGVRELVDRAARRIGESVTRILLAQLRPVETSLAERAHTDDLDLGRTAVAVPASSTPAGSGVGVGALRTLADLAGPAAGPAIGLVGDVDFEDAAAALRDARERGWDLRGAIVQGDDAVL